MKRNRLLASSLAAVLSLSLLAGCATSSSGSTPPPAANNTPAPSAGTPAPAPAPAKSVTLNVVSTYAGTDGNAPNFAQGVADWSAQTGNKVEDASGVSDETFKARILTDFETGAEPDVLFYFNGVDANPFVEAGKVVTLEEIRAEYPDYASNMNDGLVPTSPVDGKAYAVPVNGYWESLFVNKEVLAACGVEVPGPDYTWDQFLKDCETIKNAGYSPIACSLAGVPHYWFEYSIYNRLSAATHNVLPVLPTDGTFDTENMQYKAWVAAMADVKDLFDKGYFPPNTLSATDDDTFAMFTEGKAAFLIDGSWKVGAIERACGADAEAGVAADPELLENFTVTFFPGRDQRKTTDIISGLSSGYFITKKAWDDPDKRAAAVSFVEFMTTDAMVSKFALATGLSTALKNGVTVDESQMSTLGIAGLELTRATTGLAGAIQDQIPATCRVPLFDGMPEIVSGNVTPEEAVQQCLTLLAEQ